MTRCVMGVDPGATGGVAFYYPDAPGRVAVHDMPFAGGVSGGGVGDLIRQYGPTDAIVELVSAMPGQGVSSTFKFGLAAGAIHGALGALGIPYHLVTPGKWKRRMGLTSDKDASRAMACRLFPQVASSFARKKDDGRAEAALLAYYRVHQMDERNAA